MGNKLVSTLAFKSNIQPVATQRIMEDKKFLSFVRDPFALEMLYNSQEYALTAIQAKEYRSASVHCTYALENDYPWGTIVDNSGKEKVVCKCINTICKYFSECRPDFNPDESMVELENYFFSKKIDNTLKKISSRTKSDTGNTNNLCDSGDEKASAVLFGHKEMDIAETISFPQISESIIDDTVTQHEIVGEDFDNISDATFDSFCSVSQNEIIELEFVERTIVNAGPGTGKTYTLIEKIKYMLNEGVDPENILVLCFSRAAVEVIRNRLELAADEDELPLNWHLIDVRTFDSFATYMLAWLQENIPELLPDGYAIESQNYNQRIKTATDVLKKEKDMLEEYQHIIVDEVQDLVGSRAEMVLALLEGLPKSCGFTLLGDSCQALYDYLAVKDETVLSSEKFYKTIFHTYKTANFYALDRNYRQGDDFGQFTVPYRNAILSDDSGKRTSEARRLNENIKQSSVNLQRMTAQDASRYTKNGTVGILTRTNGQALQISAWLRTEGIRHQLQKPVNSMDLAAWIANVLLRTETDVIDLSEFEMLFEDLYPNAHGKAERYWEALLSTQRDQTKGHYEIEDILRGLLQNSSHPLLFEEPGKESYNITISNIHRAKGREFDSVLVLEDVTEGISDSEKNDLLEHKVCYVALTRPKKMLQKVFLKPQYIYISKDENRRCFRSGGFANRKYLSHYEIGDSTDVNPRTFARDKETQEYIRTKLSPDSRLKLLKCPKGTNAYVTYKIVLEENVKKVLGYTSWDFAIGMERAIQRIFANYQPIDYKYYPNILGDIYFNELTTCVSALDKNIEGARKFGGMYIWNGISISGFAQMEKDRY